jgi:tripartite-type tricarboxylate transporter receptor subunit TctC
MKTLIHHNFSSQRVGTRGFLCLWLIVLALISAPAAAQGYPSKPIRLVVPFAPGAIIDLAARVAAERIGSATGQPVVIENRPGAGGNTGIAQVVQSRPDGYTLGFTSDSILTINPHIYGSMPFDPLTDVVPVGLVGAATQILIVTPKSPAANLREFIALAKANPGKFSYGSGGAGSTLHLGPHVFASLAGIELTHVPYKGAAPALVDLIAGRIDLMSVTPASVMQHVRAGSVRVLAVSGSARMKALPDVPSVDEAGLPGYKSTLWFGVVAPRGTPAEVVNTLNGHLRGIATDAAARKRLDESYIDPMPITPEEFAALVRADWQRWQPIVKATGVKLD